MMPRCMFARPLIAIALVAALFALPASESTVSAADSQSSSRTVKKIRKGRLPNYFSNVVTEKQREDIYKIQEEYKPKIDDLKAQLEKLQKEMNEKISAVLTADQKKKIEDAAAAAKTKRAQNKPAEDLKPAEKTVKKSEY